IAGAGGYGIQCYGSAAAGHGVGMGIFGSADGGDALEVSASGTGSAMAITGGNSATFGDVYIGSGSLTGAVPSVWITAPSAGPAIKLDGTASGLGLNVTGTTVFGGAVTATSASNDIRGVTVSSIGANVITAAAIATDAGTELAAAVWDLATSGHTTSGTFGAAMNAAGSAGDPWSTSLPGAYASGAAGYIVGTNLNATVSSRASQTSVDTIDDYVDTEIAAILAAVDTEVAAIKAKTDSLTFTVSGQVDANIQYVNDVQITGTGTSGDEWGPP
ncbi:MAG TPA: hypothetical protein VI172_09430, partial [Candidatus Dormibacteraeota bacterium]